VAVAYLLFAAGAFVFVLNAVRPPLTNRSTALRPPWMPVMITSEVAPLAWIVLVTLAVLAWAIGVTGAWIGQFAMALSVLTILMVSWLVVRAARTLGVMRASLDGITAVPSPRYQWGRILYPWPYRIPDAIERLDAIAYAPSLFLDLYRLRGHREEPAPLLMHIHGGSWGGGDRRQQAQPLIQEMASRGWVVVSVDYPLVPEATFPDQVVALHGALRWLRDHAGKYGIDIEQMYVTGGSAGAHLASLVALTDESSAWSLRHETEPAVAGAVTMYGVYDLLDRNGIRDFWPIITTMLIKADPDLEPGKFHTGSPIDHVSSSAPAFLVVHGRNDSLVPIAESDHFVEALRPVARRPVAYARLPGATHAFDAVASLRTQQAVAGIAAFLDSAAGR
jgi:acetyl esterase/lipase